MSRAKQSAAQKLQLQAAQFSRIQACNKENVANNQIQDCQEKAQSMLQKKHERGDFYQSKFRQQRKTLRVKAKLRVLQPSPRSATKQHHVIF
jgi:hypothetical protein